MWPPNGWELSCGDENFTNVHCFELRSFQIVHLVENSSSGGSVSFSDRLAGGNLIKVENNSQVECLMKPCGIVCLVFGNKFNAKISC